MDIYYWYDYGDEGRKKYAVYRRTPAHKEYDLKEFIAGRRTKPAKEGDCHFTTNHKILLSQKMVDILGSVLEEYGELKPMTAENRKDKLYFYTITNELDCIDYKKSLNTYSHPLMKQYMPETLTVFNLIKPVIDKNLYDESMIFKINGGKGVGDTYFVTKKFIDLIEGYGLKGFKFYRCNHSYNTADKECEKQYFFG